MQPKAKKLLLFHTACLAAMLAALTAFLFHYVNSDSLRSALLARINSRLAGTLAVGGHHVSIVGGQLLLTDLSLTDARGERLAAVRELRVAFSPPALLHREIRLTTVALEGAVLNLAMDDRDRLRLAQVLAAGSRPDRPQSAVGPAWRVRIDELSFQDSAVLFERPAAGWSGRAEGISLQGSGDTAGPSARLEASVGRVSFRRPEGEQRLSALSLQADYGADRPAPFKLTVRAGESRLSLSGSLMEPAGRARFDLAADFDLVLAQLQPFLPDMPELRGRLQGRAAAAGDLADPIARAHAHFELSNGRVAAVPVESLAADVSLRGGRLTVSGLSSRSAWGGLRLSGNLDLDGSRMELRADADVPSLAGLGKLLQIALPDGRAELILNAEGPLRQPRIQADITGSRLGMAGWRFGRLTARADLDAGGVVRISKLTLRNQDSLIQGQAKLNLLAADGSLDQDPALDLELTLADVALDDFQPASDVKSRLNGSLHAGGTLLHPAARLMLARSRLQWRDAVALAEGEARWEQGRLSIPRLGLSVGESGRIVLSGSARWLDTATGRWTGQPLLKADLEGDSLQLSNFVGCCRGVLSARAAVQGRADDLNGTFRIDGRDLDLAVQKLASMSARGKLAGRRIVVSDFSAALAAGQGISGSGWYSLDRHFELALQGAGIELSHIAALQRSEPVGGRLDLKASGRGSLESPDIELALRIDRPTFDKQRFAPFTLGAHLAGKRLELAADLNFKLSAQARLDEGSFSLSAEFARTDLAPYLGMLPVSHLAGRISGQLQATGNWNELQRSRADLRLSDGVLMFKGTRLASLGQLRLSLTDGLLQLPAARLELLSDGYIEVEGSGRLDQDLRAQARGRLPLSALAPFREELADAGGAVDFSLRADGQPGAPGKLAWEADLNLSQVSLPLPGLTAPLSAVNGRLHLDPRQVRVENLEGRLDDGRFTLAGAAQLADLRPTQGSLTLTMVSLPLSVPDALLAVVSGKLTLSGSEAAALLSGNLDLVEGTYYKDVKLNLLSMVSMVTETRRAERVPNLSERPAWMKQIGLDVQVRHRNPFLVDNNVANLSIAPDLKVGGTAAVPLVTGSARVTEGTLIFRRKNFQIKSGSVDFLNPYKVDPVIDIQAESQVRQWRITVTVSGTTENLALRLSSDPALPDSDILALILTGQTGAELAGGKGSGQTTSQMLASLVASAWGEDVRRQTGMDILTVETGPAAGQTGTAAAQEDEERIQVKVGKHLSRRLTVTYEVETGKGKTVQKAVSEYRLLDHLLATGFQDSQGDYGGELLFRIEFR